MDGDLGHAAHLTFLRRSGRRNCSRTGAVRSRVKRAILLLLLAAACTTPKPAASTATATPAPPPTPALPAPTTGDFVDREGDSPQTAVAVPANAPNGGVDFQNRWIYERYGRFRRNGGGTGVLEERRYNIVKIELPDGSRKTVYFDITEMWLRSQQASPQ